MKDATPRDKGKALYAINVVCTMRGRGGYTEEQIAAQAKFESVEHMHHQLKAWGMPDWIISSSLQKLRQPRVAGEMKDLPPADSANDLFRERLNALLRAVDGLENRQEHLQGGRFYGTNVYHDPVLINRDLVKDDNAWRELCEKNGQDETSDRIWLSDATMSAAAGAPPSPSEPLSTLIGIYALAGGSVDELLEALHSGIVTEETKEAITKRITGKKKGPEKLDGLISVTQQIAKLVRGGKLQGAPAVELSAQEQDAACFITRLRSQGVSDEDIVEQLKNHRRANGRQIGLLDVQQLGNLRLTYPE